MPNGTAGAASSVTASDVVADGSQRIRSGHEDRGREEDPGHMPQSDVDSLSSKGAAVAIAGVSNRKLRVLCLVEMLCKGFRLFRIGLHSCMVLLCSPKIQRQAALASLPKQYKQKCSGS